MASLKGEDIAALMRHVWSKRKQDLNMDALQGHVSFRGALEKLFTSQSTWILEHSVRQMHQVARAYTSSIHNYIVRNGNILYKINGRDEYGSWSYGNATNAQYLDEFDRGNLTEAQLINGLALYVHCGDFSFARLPAAFTHILGVTGTLDKKKLPPLMHDNLRDAVGIQHFTYYPSMYHTQKRDFYPQNSAYVQVAKDKDEHFDLIVDEITERLKPKTEVDGERSVVVYFCDDKVTFVPCMLTPISPRPYAIQSSLYATGAPVLSHF